ITHAEQICTMLAWLEDPQYKHCRDALFDLTAAESTPRVGELRELVAILKRHRPANGPEKLAIVTSKPITFAIARIFGNLVRLRGLPLEVNVCIDPNVAWAWLRPDALPFEPR